MSRRFINQNFDKQINEDLNYCTSMSKQESQELKGVAILFMLFLHLFNHEQEVALCVNTVSVNGIALVHLMTRMTNPVPFFVILSGYGLYASYLNGGGARWSRLFNLISHYWLILVIFVTIGAFRFPHVYPGNWVKILENLTAYNTTYNAEHWFLFPYMLLFLTSSFLFKICDKFKSWVVLLVSYLLYLVTCFVISRYGRIYFYSHMFAYHPILYMSLLFNFLLGAMAYKNQWLKNINNHLLTKVSWGLLFLLCFLRCSLNTGAFHNLYVFIFIWIWLQLPRVALINTCLVSLGKHSMNMWLIHTFFCYYLFHDWIYSFRYPFLIYIVLIMVSYLSSMIVNYVYRFLCFLINKLTLGFK